jgi:hypothetical protein
VSGRPASPLATLREAFWEGDRRLWLVAVLCGALFVASLGRLWPLAAVDLVVPKARLEQQGRALLNARGFDVQEHDAVSALNVDEPALDYMQRAFGAARAQELVAGTSSAVSYDVGFKRRGEPNARSVTVHPSGRMVGWSVGVQDDEPGARLTVDDARAIAGEALATGLGVRAGTEWRETGASSRERPSRTDHTFTLERIVSTAPELRERTVAIVSGAQATYARRWFVVPGAGERAARTRRAPLEALQALGFVLLSVGVVGACTVFLLRLRAGTAQLGRAAFWSAVVFTCAFLTNVLRDVSLFAAWDPLWPRWISTLRQLVLSSQESVWTLIVLLALIAAGDALDREAGSARGASLWSLGRGRIGDPSVVRASQRGFAVGLICGGVMAATVWALQTFAGAFTAIQPRGFFFYALNSSAPALSTLLFFLNVALLEELGYRFFAGTWLLATTRRRWLAIVLPAVVYGLTHTALDFLPPAEPFWGRALVMTLVGCVWGWAFFRYDALTVVISHFTADLFIFNWPRLGSGDMRVVLIALATVAVPLIPALVDGARQLHRASTRRRRQPEAASEA